MARWGSRKRSNVGSVQRGPWPNPPESVAGLIKTPFIATTSVGRLAVWVGLGKQLVFDPEFQVDAMNSMFLDIAEEDIGFALGFVDNPPEASFTMDDGTKVRPYFDWSPPAARSTSRIEDRLQDIFEDSSQPIASMYGVASKGLNLWTLTCTAKAIYALSESGMKSLCVPWANLMEIRLKGFDLSFGVTEPEDTTYTKLHEFFQLRSKETWQPFALHLERTWNDIQPPHVVAKDLDNGERLQLHFRAVHDRFLLNRIPFGDQKVFESAVKQGLRDEIERWRDAERKAFASRFLQ